ncbi:ABC-2 type transport system permease protein [Planomicrobium stackebrandtii]|uniref:ABC-2 type transport system permease protein n=1 Tax=Planomicrobium stackebrandtii TaxID=253160 RepID=A0ABU0GWM5_9BACL|nr:ABC transporter permease [Planomicrobium stackebrandtii]MDQ0429768.1 ABC-2 type transport system permease protein [Planomicrobium stackebrandtii]
MGFFTAVGVEGLKIRKSKMIWITLAVFTAAPLMAGFFIFVLKNPEFAKSSGLIGDKAQLFGLADWPTYLSMLAQIIAVGGILVFGFVTSWVFGREYADRTIKDLLTLPLHRLSIVMAKFLAVFITNFLLGAYVVIIGVIIGFFIKLPAWSMEAVLDGGFVLLVTTILTSTLSTPPAFVACYSRGYLAPIGFILFMVVLAQVIAAAGYGAFFPWAVPALFSGIAGTGAVLGLSSFFAVFFTGLIGLAATLYWWLYADQH